MMYLCTVTLSLAKFLLDLHRTGGRIAKLEAFHALLEGMSIVEPIVDIVIQSAVLSSTAGIIAMLKQRQRFSLKVFTTNRARGVEIFIVERYLSHCPQLNECSIVRGKTPMRIIRSATPWQTNEQRSIYFEWSWWWWMMKNKWFLGSARETMGHEPDCRTAVLGSALHFRKRLLIKSSDWLKLWLADDDHHSIW